MAIKDFGNFFKQKRIERHLTLREFCKRNNLDPGNISKLERGLSAPPHSKEKLNRYAKALGLKEGSDEWIELFDLAAACRGEIPREIMDDAEVVAKLPTVFRTLRGSKVSNRKLNKLIDRIKGK